MSEPTDANALAFTTAQTYEKLAQAALAELNSHTERLHLTARDAIRRALTENLTTLTAQIERTEGALAQLSHRAHRHLLWMTPAAIAAGLTLGLGAAAFLAHRAAPSEAAAPIAALPDAALTHCRDSHQRLNPCARVDLRSGPFGPHHDYYLLASPERER